MSGRQWLRPVLALAALLGFTGPVGAAAQVRGSWLAEDRLVISDFSRVAALASDGRRIYAATTRGLLSYDPDRQRWQAPLTWEDGYPVPEEPSALAWLRAEQVLVLGTRRGRLWRVDPFAGRIEPLAGAPGPVEQLVPGTAGELFLRTPGGWLELAPGDFSPRPSTGGPPAGPDRRDLRLEALRGTLGLDAQLRRWPLTAVVPGAVPDEYFVGTDGGGMLHVDARTLEVRSVPYGVVTNAVTALARLDGQLWFGGDGAGRGRATIARADSTLQEWHWADRSRGAPGAVVNVLAETGRALWAGTGDGLYRLDPGQDRWQQFDQRDALPGNRVTSLATLDTALWVGTSRGACLWQGTTCGPTLLAGEEITALSYCGDALWIGTDRDLWRATGSALARGAPPALAGRRVGGLACHADVLYLAAENWLVVHTLGSWGEPVLLPTRGMVRALVAGEEGVWAGMDGGAAHWSPAERVWSHYVVPQDVPFGPVLGVLPAGRYLWLATPGGAVRLDTRQR